MSWKISRILLDPLFHCRENRSSACLAGHAIYPALTRRGFLTYCNGPHTWRYAAPLTYPPGGYNNPGIIVLASFIMQGNLTLSRQGRPAPNQPPHGPSDHQRQESLQIIGGRLRGGRHTARDPDVLIEAMHRIGNLQIDGCDPNSTKGLVQAASMGGIDNKIMFVKNL